MLSQNALWRQRLDEGNCHKILVDYAMTSLLLQTLQFLYGFDWPFDSPELRIPHLELVVGVSVM